MTRRTKYLLGSLAGVLILTYSAALGYLAVSETSLVFVSAGHSPWGIWLPKKGDMPWDSLRIRGDDGVPVFLMESRLDDAAQRPWAIYFHGSAGLLGSRGNVGRYRLLREAGFNVLAVEYRGYGASARSGSPSESGFYADAQAAWKHLTRSLEVEPSRVVVYGWSLGSGPAMYLAAEMRPAGVITEGAFTSLPDVGAARYPWVPAHLVMRNRFDNLARAQTLVIPWILFHSVTDSKVPFSHGKRLAAAARSAQLIPLRGGHDDGVIADRTITLPALRTLAQQLRAELIRRESGH